MSRYASKARPGEQTKNWLRQGPPTPLVYEPAIWLDASDTSTITESGGAVSQWADKSGNGANAIQPTGINQPITGTNTINSLNVVRFDGSNDFMFSNIVPGTHVQEFSYFIVAKASSAVTSVRSLLNASGTGIGSLFLRTVSAVRYISIFNTSFGDGPSVTDTNTNIYTMIATGTQSIGANGSYTAATAGAGIRGSGLNIGCNSARSGEFFNGDIAEIIYFPYVVSNAIRDDVVSYLNAKWSAF